MTRITAFTILIGTVLLAAEHTQASENGFTEYGGNWTMQGDELTVDGGAGSKLVSDFPAFTTGEVGVEILFPTRTGGNAGFIVKTSDCDIGADRFNGYEIALETSGRLVVGRHRQNFESIRAVPCDVPVNQWISLVVKMTETTLDVIVDGQRIIQYEDREHPLRRGQVGLRNWQRG
ncbi:MAG: DUF1080 domain-containing protein, partial [Phycisphaeraceae bacterium]|nr:DUF1080 domain-containing protein [Phycisphaeraceae bacterium]